MKNNAPEVIYSVKNLVKTYQMGEVLVSALNGVDLDLYAGELIVLLGPSGSGKSTLLNLLGGLDRATSGQIHFRGRDLIHTEEEELTEFRRNYVGFIFQFYNLIPSLTAEENVALVTDISKNPIKPREALDLVNMRERANHFPSQLSGGEQQRVAVARAVAKRPAILLCDEPTGALDLETGKKVLEAICRINRDIGTLTVVITHNAAIGGLADRVIRIADGKIASIEVNKGRVPIAEIRW